MSRLRDLKRMLTMSKYICNQECEYLSLKEIDQKDKTKPHMCNKFNVKLYHKQAHPNLIKCKECVNEYKKEIR